MIRNIKNNTHEARDYIKKADFERYLYKLGVTEEAIKESLEEPDYKWRQILTYYERRGNGG